MAGYQSGLSFLLSVYDPCLCRREQMTYLVETEKGERLKISEIAYLTLVKVHGYVHLIRQEGLEIIKKLEK